MFILRLLMLMEMTNQNYLTIKEAAHQYGRSEQTIRRLVKQHNLTSHVKYEEGPKGKMYLISQVLLQQEYQDVIVDSVPVIVVDDTTQSENQRLREMVADRDQLIQQLQNRLLEQGGMISHLTTQLTSQVTNQKLDRIEELVVQQVTQLGELQQRLPAPSANERFSNRRSLWRRLFGG